MGIISSFLPETMAVYRYKSTVVMNDIGEMPDTDTSDTTNLEKIGEVKCMINTGDSLEPDIRGAVKAGTIDISSMWLCWIDIPVGFEIYEADLLISITDKTRKFFIQFLDRMPGGKVGHHYECRLQTTSITMQKGS